MRPGRWSESEFGALKVLSRTGRVRDMGFIKILSLATVLIAILPIGTGASASDIEAFYGRWIGKGITENEGIAFADRDLDVIVEPAERGFTLVWKMSRTTKKKGGDQVRHWSITVPFVHTDRNGIYRMDGSSDLVSGSSYRWARIDGRVLVVHSIAISDKGVLEHQRYVRTLLANDAMQLRYTRSLDGSIVGSVLAILSRE